MAYPPSHQKRHRLGLSEVKIQLTSMMDMFTILLVFLLRSYSVQGQLVAPSQDLTLPSSKSQNPPEAGLEVIISKDWILVNQKPVESMKNVAKMEGYLIPKLYEELSRYAKEAKKVEERYGIPFSGKITIQGDKAIPYKYLIKVLATCGQSDFPNMRLLVYQKGG